MILHNSLPSITGIITSVMIKSGFFATAIKSASLPLGASTTVYFFSNSTLIVALKSSLSSTSNMSLLVLRLFSINSDSFVSFSSINMSFSL